MLRIRNWYIGKKERDRAGRSIAEFQRSILKPFSTASIAVLFVGSIAFGEPKGAPIPEDQMVSRYLQATQAQQTALRGATEEIDIDAAVPKFKKQGKLHALRSISKLGKITYKAL